MDEKEVRRFVFKVFAQSDEPGEHSIKTLWKMYLDHKGIETLDAKFYKSFKVIVQDVFIASQQQEEQLSSSQESISSPSKTSSGFSSPTKSPRRLVLPIDTNKNESDIDDNKDSDSTARRPKLYKKKATDVVVSSDDDNDNDEQEEQKSPEQDKQKAIASCDEEENLNKKKYQQERHKATSSSDEEDIEDISSQQVLQKEPIKSVDLSSDEDSYVVISSDESKNSKSSKNKVKKKKGENKIKIKNKSVSSDDEQNTDGDGDHNSRKTIGTPDSHDDDSRNRSKNVGNSSCNDSDSDEGKEILFTETIMSSLDPDVKNKKAVKNKVKKVKKRAMDKERNTKDDSVKLKNLKKYVRACNMRKNYNKLFVVCKSMKAKERLLEEVIRNDTGIEGRITLEKCKDFLRKKEEADEVAELDTSNIIMQGRGRTRRACTRPVVVAPITIPSPRSYRAKLFGNLKGIIDSEESDNDSSPIKAKKTLSLDNDSREENDSSAEDITTKKRKYTEKNTDGNNEKKRMRIDQNGNERGKDGVNEVNNTKRRKFVVKIDSSDDD